MIILDFSSEYKLACRFEIDRNRRTVEVVLVLGINGVGQVSEEGE